MGLEFSFLGEQTLVCVLDLGQGTKYLKSCYKT